LTSARRLAEALSTLANEAALLESLATHAQGWERARRAATRRLAATERLLATARGRLPDLGPLIDRSAALRAALEERSVVESACRDVNDALRALGARPAPRA
jgi:hypothetical protein